METKRNGKIAAENIRDGKALKWPQSIESIGQSKLSSPSYYFSENFDRLAFSGWGNSPENNEVLVSGLCYERKKVLLLEG